MCHLKYILFIAPWSLLCNHDNDVDTLTRVNKGVTWIFMRMAWVLYHIQIVLFFLFGLCKHNMWPSIEVVIIVLCFQPIPSPAQSDSEEEPAVEETKTRKSTRPGKRSKAVSYLSKTLKVSTILMNIHEDGLSTVPYQNCLVLFFVCLFVCAKIPCDY